MHHRKTDREFCIYVCGNIDFIRRYTQTFYADVYRCNREHRRLYAFSVKPSSRYKAPSRRSLGWSGSASRHNPRGRGGSHIALRRPTRRLRSVLVPAHARRVQTPGSADTAETRLGIGGVCQRPPRPCTRYPAGPMRVRMRQPTYRAGAGHRGTTRSAARQSLQRQPRRQHRHRRSAKRRCAATPQDSHSHRTFQTSQRPPRRH